MLYTNREGKKILMVQTWAWRRHWERYHIGSKAGGTPRRLLKRYLEVYKGRTHPVPSGIAEQCIENAIEKILDLRPDIVGLGGSGTTARKIRAGLQRAGCKAQIASWGYDVPTATDAAIFLQSYGVEPPY
jgi:DNA-binding MurR/RpiR family transcriptional regulator